MTDSQKVFIIEKRLKYTYKEIGEKLGVPAASVGRYLNYFHLHLPKEITKKRWETNLEKANEKPYNRINQIMKFAKKSGYKNIMDAFNQEGKKQFIKRFEKQC